MSPHTGARLVTTARRERVARALAQVAYDESRAHESGGEGLCMVVAASLGWALRELHGIDSTAIAGTFGGSPHWWLVMDSWRIDPTRHQFGDHHDLLYRIGGPDDAHYVDQHAWPSRWTREQAGDEGARVFIDPGYGRMWVDSLTARLSEASGELASP